MLIVIAHTDEGINLLIYQATSGLKGLSKS